MCGSVLNCYLFGNIGISLGEETRQSKMYWQADKPSVVEILNTFKAIVVCFGNIPDSQTKQNTYYHKGVDWSSYIN